MRSWNPTLLRRWQPKGAILLAALAGMLAGGTAEASLLNRWSFNSGNASAPAGTTFIDSVSGVVATVRGNGATVSGSAMVLPGTTNGAHPDSAISAYLDLPNGILSSKTNLTVEVWATPTAAPSTERIFDFGNMLVGDGLGAAGEWTGATAPNASASSDDLMLTMDSGTTLSNQFSEARIGGGTKYQVTSTLTSTAGTEYHYVLTFTDGAGTYGTGGGQIAWYRNGTLVGTSDVPFHLNNLHDVNDWIGRSQFSADGLAAITYDEVRIYDNAFTATDVTNSFNAGPNATFPAPVTQPDSVTMQYNQKARIAVLANDSGTILPSSVTVAQQPQYGTAAASSDGTILYAHTTGAPATDHFTYKVGGGGGTSAATTVTINFTNNLRIANSTLNVPSTPPATSVQLAPAFPGLAAFSNPLCMVTPPGETKRLFVCEKVSGQIKLIPDVTVASGTGASTASVFLDMGALLTSRGDSLSTSSEQGLLGLAFHPNYATNGYFFIYYSVTHGGAIYDRLARFKVQSGNPSVADTTSETILISQAHPQTNHNGGDLHFGTDGYLYFSLGDGGAQNDQLGNAQHIDKDFFSGIMRIDVDKKAGNLEPNPQPNTSTPSIMLDGSGKAYYSVPADNPFVGATTFDGGAILTANLRAEFWAVGLRNPWRFSFDSVTGELWVGNVGQDKYEGAYLVTKGMNGGWSFFEQNHVGPRPPPGNFTYTHPIYEYAHSGVNSPANPSYEGSSIIGGVVYRGSKYSSFVGQYFFGDYVSGNIWTLSRSGTTATVNRITGLGSISAFGTDPSNGDVLVANLTTGVIQRITTATVISSFPQTLSATGLFADMTTLSPNPGLLPYQPNLTFWSDFAVKSRWFIIPDGTSKITWSKDGAWTFPAGMIWVKHFELESVRSNPPVTGGTSARIRIETRLLVKNASGVYGVSYRWNAAGTDATLVADAGDDFAVNVTQNGQAYAQQWHIPARADCITCHNAQAGGALSFNTRQLNQANVINGFAGNQLTVLNTGGYFANSPGSPNLLPRFLRPDETSYPVEARVRSYFAVNCAYCHQAGGPGPSWDGRPQLTLTQTGLISGTATSALHAGDKLIVPNDVTHSVVYNRVSLSNGYTRMPPLASNELDQTDIALLQSWITQSLPSRQTYDQWHQTAFGTATPAGGDQGADADLDGETNYTEFLAGTDPLRGGSAFRPAVSISGGNAVLSINVPANRSVSVETSTDLVNWQLWDVPGNGGVPQAGGLSIMTGVAQGPRMFFRVTLIEN